jgi:acyl-CoA synthetase (AMP-forming)/AMP-acid ligase II
MGSFDPERILDHIEKYRVSLFAGIPTMYRMLLDSGAEQRDLSSVRLWGGGGDAFPHDLVQKFRSFSTRGFGPFKRKAAFITGYGLAETAGQVSITLPFALGDNCIGWLMPGVHARLVDAEGKDVPDGDVGELILRTPGLMQGYWNDPEGTQTALRDGWFYTGDLMRKGKWGLKYFVSREKEMIKVGGYSVFPAEVEKVLDSHPDVERSVVVGLPHPTKGELPVAGVVTGAGSRLTERDLEIWISERVAPYRCPRRVVFIEEIPQNFSMKPLRRLVRDRLIQQGIKVEARSDRERKRVIAS